MGDALIKDDYRRKFKENKYIVAYRTYKTLAKVIELQIL